MKTPRELLLSHHETVVPKLDALRRRVVAEHVNAVATGEQTSPSQGLWARLGQELFWSSRWAWMGLGCFWLVITLLHFAAQEPSSRRALAADKRVSLPVMQAALAEQQRLRAELLETLTTSSTLSAQPSPPPPRSEFHGPFPNA
jgi:hypothetical protein